MAKPTTTKNPVTAAPPTKVEPPAETTAIQKAPGELDTDIVEASDDLPSWIPKAEAPIGTENIAPQDMRVPRLSIAQPPSSQLIKSDPLYIPGLQQGDLFNDITGEIYGDAPVEVLFVRADKPRHMEFNDDRSVKDPFVPAGDPRTLFRDDGKGNREPPIATKFFDFVVVLLRPDGRLEPLSLSFKGMGLKVATKLNSLIALKRVANVPIPIWGCKYRLTPVPESNSKGNWTGLKINQMGLVKEDLYKAGEQFYNQFKDTAIPFDQTPREPGSDDDI